MYVVQIWWQSLHICGNCWIFSKFKMAAAAILDFQNFYFSLNHHMHATFLRKSVKFCDDQSTHTRTGLIFRNFCFGLNFPFEGLFGEVFGGRRPPKGSKYNSNPQKAQQATEWRHLTHRSWKSADWCGHTACRRKHKQKKARTQWVIFHPFPGGRLTGVGG